MLALLLGVSVLAAASRTAHSAPAPGTLTLSLAQVYDAAKAPPAQPQLDFSYKSTSQLALLLRVKLATSDGKPRRIGVFAAVSDADGNVVRKIKESYDQQPGDSDYKFAELLSLAGILGDQDYNVDIEISAKGFAGAKQKLKLSLHGPPAPEFKLHSLRLFNEEGRESDYFEPGARFSAELSFSIYKNQTTLLPRLGVVAGTVGPYSYGHSSSSADVLLNSDSDALDLEPGAQGEYTLRFSGRLPKYYDQPDSDQHAFGLLCRLYFGDERLASVSRLGVVLDNRSKGERGKKGGSERSLKLEPPEDWDLRLED